MERNDGKNSIFVLAVNGNETPALALLGKTYSTETAAEMALPQSQQDYEFSPMTVREIKPGQTFEIAK
jgi:hypothetical protein